MKTIDEQYKEVIGIKHTDTPSVITIKNLCEAYSGTVISSQDDDNYSKTKEGRLALEFNSLLEDTLKAHREGNTQLISEIETKLDDFQDQMMLNFSYKNKLWERTLHSKTLLLGLHRNLLKPDNTELQRVIEIFDQSKVILEKEKEELIQENKAIEKELMNSTPIGELRYAYKNKAEADKARIKKTSNLIVSSAKRDIDEIKNSKYQPEELLNGFLSRISGYNRQEQSDTMRTAYQEYSQALIAKYPEITELANTVKEYIYSDNFKNARDINIIKASKEHAKKENLLKGNLEAAKEELGKAVISLSPPSLPQEPDKKLPPVIPKEEIKVIGNLKSLVDRLERKKESILAKVDKEHQESVRTELDKEIESLYENRKNELLTESVNKAIIDRIDNFTALEANKSKTKQEIIESFKIKHEDAEQQQQQMTKIAKDTLIKELKEHIIAKNNKKDISTESITSMLNVQNALLDKNHQIKLDDVEEEAKKLAAEEMSKKKSSLTGAIQHLMGTSSKGKVEDIIKNLKSTMQNTSTTNYKNPTRTKTPTTSHKGPMGLAKKFISKVKGARQ